MCVADARGRGVGAGWERPADPSRAYDWVKDRPRRKLAQRVMRPAVDCFAFHSPFLRNPGGGWESRKPSCF